MELAAPGLDKGDFEINVDKDQLTISVKKETSNEVKEEKFTRKEFSYSTFTRSFHLPEGVKADAIEASYENGVLGIALPKKEEAKALPARTIEVK
ncbi:MAG: Hsp20/alpha crystallin family protein [Bacteroidota bacterium]